MNKVAQLVLDYLKEHDEMGQLPQILSELQKESYRSQTVRLISAQELTKEEVSEISASLVAKWGEHELSLSVDPSLISGMIIRFGDTVIDRSGRKSLSDLSASLTPHA